MFGNYKPDIGICISNDFVLFGFVFISQFLLSINYNVLLSSDFNVLFVNKKILNLNNVIVDMVEGVEIAMIIIT